MHHNYVDEAIPAVPIDRGTALAKAISNIINPFVVTFVVVLLVCVGFTPSAADAVRWALLTSSVSIVPVLALVMYLVHAGKVDGILVSSQQQRKRIFPVAGACGIIGSFLLFYLNAPLELSLTYVSGLANTLIFMTVNHWWKISLHSAFVAGAAAVLTILFGPVGALSAALLLPVAWSRTRLGHHSVTQVAVGALAAAAVVVVIFYAGGLM